MRWQSLNGKETYNHKFYCVHMLSPSITNPMGFQLEEGYFKHLLSA